MMIVPRRGLAAVVAVLVAFAPMAVARAGACPYERTCAAYAELTEARFPSSSGGTVRIEYYVNPLGAITVSEADVVGAMRLATRVWEKANPRLRFVYRGITKVVPGVNDGVNVIGFGIPVIAFAIAEAKTSTDGDRMVDADITFNATVKWNWQPCVQRDGACGPESPRGAPFGVDTQAGVDIQGIATHELGHWLSLNHPDQEDGAKQTMAVVAPLRAGQTLALGDIVGVRAMYPCGRCSGKPVVFVP